MELEEPGLVAGGVLFSTVVILVLAGIGTAFWIWIGGVGFVALVYVLSDLLDFDRRRGFSRRRGRP